MTKHRVRPEATEFVAERPGAATPRRLPSEAGHVTNHHHFEGPEMVRAQSGQTPRGRSIMPRNLTYRKCRPSFEGLETKQLLSAGPFGHGAQAIVQAPAPVSSQVVYRGVMPDGTGKSVVIITS